MFTPGRHPTVLLSNFTQLLTYYHYFIDFSEIKQTMHFLGEAVTDDEVRQMIKEADLDKNGSIDFRGKLVNLTLFFLSRILRRKCGAYQQKIEIKRRSKAERNPNDTRIGKTMEKMCK
ncbi:unnamed protein product [Schistosoma margrebowiei]|uniref:Uncharacterized protein n=1 Tax=Schistosoma margrebowiei TaxID=48269 RepID=A0A183MR43_9TREM|nr:unnamed protein product [Schistosoma margrebowiei]